MHNDISLRHGMEQMIFWIADNPMGAWCGSDPRTIQKKTRRTHRDRNVMGQGNCTCKKKFNFLLGENYFLTGAL